MSRIVESAKHYARDDAAKLGHVLGRFYSAYSYWRARCRKCWATVEVDEDDPGATTGSAVQESCSGHHVMNPGEVYDRERGRVTVVSYNPDTCVLRVREPNGYVMGYREVPGLDTDGLARHGWRRVKESSS